MENTSNSPVSIFVSSSLESVNKIYALLGNRKELFENLHNEWVKNTSSNFPFIFDMRNLIQGRDDKLNISALTVFLSYAHFLKSIKFKTSIPLSIEYNEYANTFLNHIDFFRVIIDNRIFSFNELLKEGNIKYNFNPSLIIFLNNSKIKAKYTDLNELTLLKAVVYENLKQEVNYKLSKLFSDSDSKYIDQKYKASLFKISAEIATNSMIHGNSPVFLCFQRIESWKKNNLTFRISICDSGVGFLRSFKNSHTWSNSILIKTELDTILNASLMDNPIKTCLKNVIDETVNNYNGSVTINSYDGEIHWAKDNWNEALQKFKFSEYKTTLQETSSILENKVDFPTFDDYKKGYYRKLNTFLTGTRIFFELNFPINK